MDASLPAGLVAGTILATIWSSALGASPPTPSPREVVASARATSGTATPPWVYWLSPTELPRVRLDHRVLLRSSRCPSGCRFDRHSAGDSRFSRVEGDEGVIFEDHGPGAITRLWMTTGAGGVSIPLDPSIRFRLYLDQDVEPRLDLPLPALFDGSTPPFQPPLVADREGASGGFVSHVPIPYRQGARITLVGAEEATLWFQVHYHRLSAVDGIVSFTGDEDLSPLTAQLATPGADPWPKDSAEESTGDLTLSPGESIPFYRATGPGLLTGLRWTLAPEHRALLALRATFDGQTTLDLPLSRAVGLGRDTGLRTRSWLAGLDAQDRPYLYFPMPFFEDAELRLVHLGTPSETSGTTAPPGPTDPSVLGPAVPVSWWVRRSQTPPAEDSGLFEIRSESWAENTPRRDLPLLRRLGAGKWVGLFAELGSRSTEETAGMEETAGPILQTYLEGDERIYLDGSIHPAHYGTGVEDFFGAGFYFDQGPFRRALHGMTYDLEDALGRVTAAYRLMPGAAPVFGHRIDARLEAGPTGITPMRLDAVAYLYRRPGPTLESRDALDLGDADSRRDHGWVVVGDAKARQLDAQFESEPPVSLLAEGFDLDLGQTDFELSTEGCLGDAVLRRRLDAGLPSQRADVILADGTRHPWPATDPNEDRRWREVDLPLRLDPLPNPLSVTVERSEDDTPVAGPSFSAFRYLLLCSRQSHLFADGFESGSPEAWSLIGQ